MIRKLAIGLIGLSCALSISFESTAEAIGRRRCCSAPQPCCTLATTDTATGTAAVTPPAPPAPQPVVQTGPIRRVTGAVRSVAGLLLRG